MSTPRPFRFGVVAAQAHSAEEWVAGARRAESLGYSTLLIPDTLGPTFSPMPALAVAAAATRSLRLGTYVLANDFRNPVSLARECAALDFLSGGRFELGLGAGRPTAGEDYRKLGIPLEPGGVRVERLAEALSIVKALLGGERVSATGPHYRAQGADVFPHPVQEPRPPILVAASGKRLLSLAAREADIVALAGYPTESQHGIGEKTSWLRRAAGDRFSELEININLLAAAQEEELARWVSARLGFDVAELVRSGSPFVLMGAPDEMCEQLLERRETLGASYVTVPDYLTEAFAPVVERLAGR
ncbi:MAG TPA: TIGR03621 family F420-dependent LLM class oxidoreductase [Candidatus Sulfotelmatobacter sp.]|nr:TIGR03621 family F420-dependent LLM class oxidoreductase [Candidatus Sulfotelmatobacter sp.]